MSVLSTGTLVVLLAVSAFTRAPAVHVASQVPDNSDGPGSDGSKEFFRSLQALNLHELSPESLWPLLEGCQRQLTDSALETDADAMELDAGQEQAAWMRRYTCSSLATELARRGSTSDRDRLWRTFDDSETDDEARAGIVRGMLASRLREAAADPAPVAAAVPPANGDPFAGPLPARFADVVGSFEQQAVPAWFQEGSPELREAWRLAASAERAYLRATLVLAGEDPLSYMVNEAAFLEAVADYLRGRIPAAEALKRVGRFEWGGGCGFGAGAFHEPRDQVVLLALMELGRADLAAGAMLAVANGDVLGTPTPLTGEVRTWPRLAERLGVDWERLAIGSLLDRSPQAAMAVALLGSEQGARLLLRAMEQRAPDGDGVERLGDGDTSMATIAALVRPGEGCDGFAKSSIDEVREASELPIDIQLEALAALAASADDASGLEVASEAARQLHRLCRVESLPAFEAMSRSRFSVLREHAARARHVLAGDGLVTAAATPVEFRVIVDGAPWHGGVVATLLRGDGWTYETIEADSQGRLNLQRDPFVDSKAPVRGVRIEAPGLDGPAATWFAGEARAPRDLQAITVVSVETQGVTIVLPDQHAGRCAEGACRVQLEVERPITIDDGSEPGMEYRSFRTIGSSRALHSGERWTVRLVRGFRYRAIVKSARGSWTSSIVVPRAQPLTLTLRGDRLRSLEEEVLSRVEAYGVRATE
jgi:hypothetical protein